MTHFLTLALLIVNLPSHLNLQKYGIKIKYLRSSAAIFLHGLVWAPFGTPLPLMVGPPAWVRGAVLFRKHFWGGALLNLESRVRALCWQLLLHLFPVAPFALMLGVLGMTELKLPTVKFGLWLMAFDFCSAYDVWGLQQAWVGLWSCLMFGCLWLHPPWSTLGCVLGLLCFTFCSVTVYDCNLASFGLSYLLLLTFIDFMSLTTVFFVAWVLLSVWTKWEGRVLGGFPPGLIRSATLESFWDFPGGTLICVSSTNGLITPSFRAALFTELLSKTSLVEAKLLLVWLVWGLFMVQDSGFGFLSEFGKSWGKFSLFISFRQPPRDSFSTWVLSTGSVPLAVLWSVTCCFVVFSFCTLSDPMVFLGCFPSVDDPNPRSCWLLPGGLPFGLEETLSEVSLLPSFGGSNFGLWDLVILAGLDCSLMLMDLVVLTGKATWLVTSFLGPIV